MTTDDLLKLRSSLETAPSSDTARQAVNALRGYTYQLVASALAWINIPDDGRLYLEVAEDYAVVAGHALSAVQVKDTKKSGTITLNSDSVRRAIAAFVEFPRIIPTYRFPSVCSRHRRSAWNRRSSTDREVYPAWSIGAELRGGQTSLPFVRHWKATDSLILYEISAGHVMIRNFVRTSSGGSTEIAVARTSERFASNWRRG